MNDRTLYEFPLNERVRLFIRLEQLFLQLDHFRKGRSVWDHRASVGTLIDIVGVFNRNDLKSEAMQEIDRQTSVLNRMARQNDGIDSRRLNEVISSLDGLSKNLYAVPGKVALALNENELFKNIAQRSSIPGGTCSFDLPAYHHLLESDPDVLRQELSNWLQPFEQVRSAIDLLLNFIRNSAVPVEEIAQAGFFQKTLDPNQACQLLRVGLPSRAPYYAEISGGKHRFTIRLMQRVQVARPVQVPEDVSFELTCCLF